MKKRNILLTGGTSGIGLEATIELLKDDHKVILLCRNKASSKKAVKNINSCIPDLDYDLVIKIADLSDIESLIKFTDNIIREVNVIDTLVLNAGLQYSGSKVMKKSAQGFELTLAVNHMANQFLVSRLITLVLKSKDPRVIITSSEVHNPESSGGKFGSPAGLGSLEGISINKKFCSFDRNEQFDADRAYKNSKLCNILFARELSRRLIEKRLSIPVIAWAPGLVIPRNKGGFFRYSRKFNELGQIIFALLARDIFSISESVSNAGKILKKLSVDKIYSLPGFSYYSNNLIYPGNHKFESYHVSEEANNDCLAMTLWETTCELLGISTHLQI